jgi:hypothetical protein
LIPKNSQICNRAPIRSKWGGKLVTTLALVCVLIHVGTNSGNMMFMVDVKKLWEVLSLGSCSKYLNGVCESDCTWKLLYKRRWGRQAIGESSEDSQTLPVNKKVFFC